MGETLRGLFGVFRRLLWGLRCAYPSQYVGEIRNDGNLETAVFYHLVHAVVLLVLSGWRPVPRAAYNLVLGGVIVFSGSLYLLALTDFKWFGAITPLGGLGMLAGWLVLGFTKAKELGAS